MITADAGEPDMGAVQQQLFEAQNVMAHPEVIETVVVPQDDDWGMGVIVGIVEHYPGKSVGFLLTFGAGLLAIAWFKCHKVVRAWVGDIVEKKLAKRKKP